MKLLMDSAGRLFNLVGQVFLDVGIASENGRQDQIYWPGE